MCGSDIMSRPRGNTLAFAPRHDPHDARAHLQTGPSLADPFF
jgi:hypothetical protein